MKKPATGSTAGKAFGQIGIVALAMLITSSIDNVRNLPAIALFGPTLPFFFVLATVFFLLPTALIAAQLAICAKDEGGIYAWAKTAFGSRAGALAIWLQWINTMVWFPSILAFIAATGGYLIAPNLVHEPAVLLAVCLIIFWLVTLLNLFGLKIAAWFATACTFLGMLLPMALIIMLGVFWLTSGAARNLHFTQHNIWPHLNHIGGWVGLTGIMAGFLGIELTNVHARDLKNPAKLFPRALSIAVGIIVVTMIGGALAIAIVLPEQKISLVAGIMQALRTMLQAHHMSALLPIVSVLIVLGSIGKLVNWLISPAKGLMQAAEDNFMPKTLAKCNKYNMPTKILLLQAVVVSVISGAMLIIPSVNGIYWLLTDLSTELYLIMYVIMFFSAWKISRKLANSELNLVRGHKGMATTCCFGLAGTFISLLVGFIPPQFIAVGGSEYFELVFVFGLIILLLPVLWLWRYKTRSTK